jgi:hypothetical protein
MIRETNAQAAIDLAQEFDRRGLGISFKEDSLLKTLYVAGTVDFVTPTVSAPDGYNPTAQDVMSDSLCPQLGSERSAHDEALDQAVEMIQSHVRSHISFAKNVVRPVLQDLVERVEAGLKAMPESATFNPEVKRVDLPAPMLSNVFEGMVTEFAEITYFPITSALDMPALSGEEVIALLDTGSKLVDGDIATWAASQGTEFFRQVFAVVFTRALDIPKGANYTTLIDDPVTGADAAVACFLLAKKLIDSPPEGMGMSLNEYRRAVGEVLSQSGLRLAQAYETKARQEKAGQLILTYNRNEVRVLAPVYDKWVEGGGSGAALFGNLLTDSPSLYGGMIDSKSAELVQIWERQNRLLTSALQNRRFRDTVTLLHMKVESVVADHMVACFGPLVESVETLDFQNPVVREAMTRITSYIDGLTPDDIGSLWKMCTELVAGCIFYYTDSLKILEGINACCASNPDIDPEEAALMSAVEYVVDYLVDQLYVFDL